MQVFTFEIANGDKSNVGPHHHTVDLTETQLRELKSGKRVTALTSSTGGHDHEVTLEYRVAKYPDKTLQHCKYGLSMTVGTNILHQKIKACRSQLYNTRFSV